MPRRRRPISASLPALAGYEEIERRLGSGGSARSLTILRARKGVLLVQMARDDEAVPVLHQAQAGLARDDATLRGDRYLVAWSIGIVEERSFDFAAARRAYEQAEAEAPDPISLRATWAARARVTMFDDPATALRFADRALADILADGKAPKNSIAQYRTLKGRVLLNARNFHAARTELEQALADLGGLTSHADLVDVASRSDLAIAALLDGAKEQARKYLAYTGAGTDRDVLASPQGGDFPQCGGDYGLTPEDVAVVEFSIEEDGSVSSATPIYASRSGPAALEFARAVRTWTWAPEGLVKIKPFFRALVRVELRCSMQQDRPSVPDLLKPAVVRWREVEKLPPDASSSAKERTQGDADERLAAAQQALAAAEAVRAPAPVLAYYAIRNAFASQRRDYSRRAALRTVAALNAAAARPEIAMDGQARAAVRLVQADLLMSVRHYTEAAPLLDGIAGDTALDGHDALKVGALLRLATIKATAGDLAAARSAYDRTGLSAQACALVDVQPAMVARNNGAGQFPREAMIWGFEGWARTEFDISSDGRTTNVRAIAAYPPFVFSPASIAVMSGARFTQTYRPEGGLGCGGQQQNIRFSLPGLKK